eukprot:TRINITY_DN5121_c0_g1_i1.p1 TRINITY_DN5121_c0_g1~~TRINITY_DN5121_c0_g1_i1.p1  ORF type:complete len:714 (+),score=288.04 TRINITY_DN5121_c0_g1_i1:473-2614(+)
MIMGFDDGSLDEDGSPGGQEEGALRALEQLKKEHVAQLEQMESLAADQQAAHARRVRESELRLREEVERHARETQAMQQKHRQQQTDAEALSQGRVAQQQQQLQQMKAELQRSEERAAEAERRVADRDDTLRARADELQELQRQRHMLKNVVHRLQQDLAHAADQNAPARERERENDRPAAAVCGDDAGDETLRELNELRLAVNDKSVRLRETEGAVTRLEQERTQLQHSVSNLRRQSVMLEERLTRAEAATATQAIVADVDHRQATAASDSDYANKVAVLTSKLQQSVYECRTLQKERQVDQATVAALRADVSALLARLRDQPMDADTAAVAARCAAKPNSGPVSPRARRTSALSAVTIDSPAAEYMAVMGSSVEGLSVQVNRLQTLMAECVRLREQANRRMNRMTALAHDGAPLQDLAAVMSESWIEDEESSDGAVIAESIMSISCQVSALIGFHNDSSEPLTTPKQTSGEEAATQAARLCFVTELKRARLATAWAAQTEANGKAAAKAVAKSQWRLARVGVCAALRTAAGVGALPLTWSWWKREGYAHLVSTKVGGLAGALAGKPRPAWECCLRLLIARCGVRRSHLAAAQWTVDKLHAEKNASAVVPCTPWGEFSGRQDFRPQQPQQPLPPSSAQGVRRPDRRFSTSAPRGRRQSLRSPGHSRASIRGGRLSRKDSARRTGGRADLEELGRGRQASAVSVVSVVSEVSV